MLFRSRGNVAYRPQTYGYKSIQMPEQRGLLDLYQNDIYPTLSAIEAQDAATRRASDLAAIQQYGPQYTQALLAANPNQKALVDEMNRQAITDLQAGQSLTPGEVRSAQQASRAAFAARGLGTGNASLADEVLRNYNLGVQREAQRRAFAQGVIGINSQVTGDPFLQILGRPSQLIQQGQGFGTQAQQGISNLGAQLFNPESQYAGDIYNQRYQMQAQANAANAANTTALYSAGIQAAGSILGGAAKGGMFNGLMPGGCWVAREVYGIDNPRWLAFRDWILTDAPAFVRQAYATHGERWARWLATKPRIKMAVRRLMNSILGGV